MKQPNLPLIGQCRCGAVTVEVSAAPILTAACHCRGCQVMSASAFSLTALIPCAGFRVVSGTPVRGGLKGPQLNHMFCPTCMSWMFTTITGIETIPGLDAFVNVRPSLFPDPTWFVPFIETMTAEKLPWATTPAEHHYEGFPSGEEFAELLDAFRNHLTPSTAGES